MTGTSPNAITVTLERGDVDTLTTLDDPPTTIPSFSGASLAP